MTSQAYFNTQFRTDPMPQRTDYPMPILVLSTILYAVFAFVVTIVALNVFPPGGFVLALALAWRGGFIPGMAGGSASNQAAKAVRPQMPERATQSTGNSSFDAYRADMLNRLETEQSNFENFLGRLRDAKDKSEFDRFMDERADRARTVESDRADTGFDRVERSGD